MGLHLHSKMGHISINMALLPFLIFLCLRQSSSEVPSGDWRQLQRSIGISAMHMQLLNNDEVIMFDRTDFGRSNISLPNSRCRIDPEDIALTNDCTAHSVAYNLLSNSVRPLFLQTDAWCSSGAVLPNGTLVQTGGYNDGERKARTIQPCNNCDWYEISSSLSARRWYATNQILPDGRIIIMGGRRQFSYEFLPSSGDQSAIYLPFLQETFDESEENNLYPFLHLLPDGNLFVFANTKAILFDYVNNRVIKDYPSIPGGYPRNYPSSGSSVLLPVRLDAFAAGKTTPAEVMVCGGALRGSFIRASAGEFVGAVDTCGRLMATDSNPTWQMEQMPRPRVMGDMLLLPTGDVLIINGAGNGTAGWELARNPVLSPILYRPYETAGARFRELTPSSTPRMYHSTAIVVSDGSVLVGGSNPHIYYNFSDVLYPTDLSLESFLPPYLSHRYSSARPSITSMVVKEFSYQQLFAVDFMVPAIIEGRPISVTMLYPSFTTHALSMNQRLIVLNIVNVSSISPWENRAMAMAPTAPAIAPPGYYLLFVVHAGIPSSGVWVKVQ